jgi:hypothetical protein
MNRAIRRSIVLLSVLGACGDAGEPFEPGITPADRAMGQLAFTESCSGCHASSDGFDLRTFGFSDTTIIRRAVHHVDSSSARNIAAYIATLSTPHNPASMKLFQPKGGLVPSDMDFARELFGVDGWPGDMTSARLLGMNPRDVRIAVALPVWSDEKSNLDWMPDTPLPPGILDYAGGHARAAIAGYRAVPTDDNLVRAVNALRTADRAAANPDAPCLLDDSTRVRYRQCFDVRRWTSTLVALHFMRNGMNTAVGGRVHDIWWDVGNAARKSRADRSAPIDNAVGNWVTWMFLGWSFDPSLHSSSYTGGGFRQLGHVRHATFVTLRSQVARARNSTMVYEDLLNAAKFAPPHWTLNAVSFALSHSAERLAAGDRPATAALRAEAVARVNSALTESFKKIPGSDRSKLEALAAPVITGLSAD